MWSGCQLIVSFSRSSSSVRDEVRTNQEVLAQ
jgi:hypothetical protein